MKDPSPVATSRAGRIWYGSLTSYLALSERLGYVSLEEDISPPCPPVQTTKYTLAGIPVIASCLLAEGPSLQDFVFMNDCYSPTPHPLNLTPQNRSQLVCTL